MGIYEKIMQPNEGVFSKPGYTVVSENWTYPNLAIEYGEGPYTFRRTGNRARKSTCFLNEYGTVMKRELISSKTYRKWIPKFGRFRVLPHNSSFSSEGFCGLWKIALFPSEDAFQSLHRSCKLCYKSQRSCQFQKEDNSVAIVTKTNKVVANWKRR